MKKWNWLRGVCSLASVGAALVGGVASAQDATGIPTIANPDAVFQPTSYSWLQEVAPPAAPAAEAPAEAAAEEAPAEGPWKLSDALLGEEKPFDFGGWTQFGYHTKSDGIFNTHPHHVDLQQFNLYAEKIADGSCGIGFGGRVDVMYGTDAQNTQSFGNVPGRFDFNNAWNHGVYGFAMPQLYGEVAVDNLSVKVGHFYTPLGYQVVPATGNFFYSIPFTFNFSEAFTHTGALATYKATDDVTLYGGWTLGWDTGFDRRNGGSNFLGGASVKLTDSVTATYITTIGNLGWIGEGYAHSIVVDWVINDKWEYVFQSDTMRTDLNPYLGVGNQFDTVGVNQYLFYTINDCLKAGTRAEWFKADGISYNEVAFGVNVTPIKNLRIRPEVRYQWSPNANNFLSVPEDQTIFGIDAILTF